MKIAVWFVTAAFWLSVAALASWLAVYAWDEAPIIARFGEKGSRLGLTSLLGSVALASGLLVSYHRLTSTYVDRDAYWTGAEVFYAAALFASLLFGTYSFLSWYYSWRSPTVLRKGPVGGDGRRGDGASDAWVSSLVRARLDERTS